MRQRPFKLDDRWEIQDQGDDGLMALSRDGLVVIASWGLGWDHVSISRSNRCPDWSDMCRVKDLFWDAEECVMQLHPPKSQYRNLHPYCLHLWKPQGKEIPMPYLAMV